MLRRVDFSDGFTSSSTPSVTSVVGIQVGTHNVNFTTLVNGFFTLPSTPSLPATFSMSWQGVEQYENEAFVLIGDKVQLNGYSIFDFLEVGDIVKFSYQ